MKIRLTPTESRDKAMAQVTQKQAELATSKWHKLANGDFGQSMVGEGKMMLTRLENEIKQLIDIANHKPAEPTVFVAAYDAYAEKEILKANGFRWDGKCWGRNVKVANLDDVLVKIGATISEHERLLAGM